jgi:hypothetical protein
MMTNPRRHAHVTGCSAIALTLGWAAMLYAPRALAAEGGCSNWVSYAKRACLSSDDGALTGSVEVGSGGRGWYGYLELTGPEGSLEKSAVQILRAPDSLSITWKPSDGSLAPGQYCAIDWRYDAYWQSHYPFNQPYYVESQYCLTVK